MGNRQKKRQAAEKFNAEREQRLAAEKAYLEQLAKRPRHRSGILMAFAMLAASSNVYEDRRR